MVFDLGNLVLEFCIVNRKVLNECKKFLVEWLDFFCRGNLEKG